MIFSKRIGPANYLSCTIRKGGIFFLKTWHFLPGRKMREEGPISRNTQKHDIFYLIFSTPSLRKKNQRRCYPAKIHLKVIDIPDRRPRKSSGHSLYLHGEIYRRFHILLSRKKKKKNRKHNIQDRSLTSFSIYSVGDILQ